MALDQKFFKKSTAATGLADQAEGLILHLDANDVDSYDGDGSIWYDIANHEVNIPLADKASNLQLHLNASDTTSYRGSGTTWTDISGNGRHGTINGGVESTYATGIRGSFDFAENTGDYVNVTHHADLKPSSNGVTYEFWITPEEISGTDTYLYTGSTSGYGSVYFRLENGVPYQTAYNSSNGVVTNTNTGTALTAGSLHHVVLTISDITNPVTKLYQDGTLKATHTGSGTIHYLTEDLKIGRYTTGNANDFNGLIHAVRVYNTVLTAAEVGQNYRAGNFLSYSSIITSKHEATQGDLVTVPPTQGTLHTSNLGFHLDANGHSGTYWTDSANNINGTINGATYVNDNNSDYFTFDGSDDTVTFPASDTSPINFSSETHAIEFWVNFNTLANDDVILGKFGGSNATKSFQIQVSSTNKLTILERDGGNNYTYETTGTFSTGTWTHFAYTRSASTIKLYINGTLDKSDTANNAINAGSTQDIIIGNQSGASVYFDGKLAQLRIYSSTLDSSQVLTNYNATKDLYQGVTSLVASYDANGYSSGSWLDTSGNDRHITITGATHTNDNNSDYFTFDGNDYMQTPASTEFNIGNTGTFEMWHWLDSTYDETLLYQGDSSYTISTLNYHFRVNGGNYQMLTYNSGNMILASGTSSYFSAATDAWHHLVITFGGAASGSPVKIYLDGVEVKSTTLSSAANTGNYPVSIGRRERSVAYSYYNGRMSQIRFYKGPMTAAQVKTNYDATKVLYQNPIALIDYRPDQYSGSGTSITNLGSLSNDAVLTGGIESTYDQELGNSFDIVGTSNSGDGIETTSNVTGVNLNSDGFSYEFWVNIKSDNFSYIASFNYSTTTYNMSYRANFDKILFFNNGSHIFSSTLQLNRWYHIVGTADSSGTKVYTDGILTGSNTTAAPNHNLNSKVYFGTYHSHTSADHIHDGPIGDARFYKGALTAEQVAQNYLATKNKYPNGYNFTVNSGVQWLTNSNPAYNYFHGDAANEPILLSNVNIDISMGMTVSVWLRNHAGTGDYQNLFRMAGTGWSGYLFLIGAHGAVRYFYSQGTGTEWSTYNSSGNWTTDWINVIHVREANGSGTTNNRGEIYINGVSHATNNTLTAATDITTIGFGWNVQSSRVDNVDSGMLKIFQRPFSDAEALAEFNATKSNFGIT